jgi:hypothetical protein
MSFAAKYDETNPRSRATTTPDDLDHGNATRLHCKYDFPSFSRDSGEIPIWHGQNKRDGSRAKLGKSYLRCNRVALLEPSLLFCPCQIGISPEYAPYQKPRPHPGLDNADIGPSLSHVSLYRTKTLSRTYLYDFVCDVTRFTHLVTSHSQRRSGRWSGRTGGRTRPPQRIPWKRQLYGRLPRPRLKDTHLPLTGD